MSTNRRLKLDGPQTPQPTAARRGIAARIDEIEATPPSGALMRLSTVERAVAAGALSQPDPWMIAARGLVAVLMLTACAAFWGWLLNAVLG